MNRESSEANHVGPRQRYLRARHKQSHITEMLESVSDAFDFCNLNSSTRNADDDSTLKLPTKGPRWHHHTSTTDCQPSSLKREISMVGVKRMKRALRKGHAGSDASDATHQFNGYPDVDVVSLGSSSDHLSKEWEQCNLYERQVFEDQFQNMNDPHERMRLTCKSKSLGEVSSIPVADAERGSATSNCMGSPWERTKVEVMTGCIVPLRGKEESWEALCRGEVAELCCPECDVYLMCINKASMVICPCCRCISSMIGYTSTSTERLVTGSLGLGMTVELIEEEFQNRYG